MRAFLEFGHRESEYAMTSHVLHCHAFYELYYFVRGDVDYMIEGAHVRMEPGMALLLSSGAFHGLRTLSARPYERYALHFTEDALPDELREALTQPFVHNRVCPGAAALCPELEALARCDTLPENLREPARRARIAGVLLTLLAYLRGGDAPQGREPDLAQRATAYIGAHLEERLTVDALAKRFYVGRSQLERAFTRATGTSVAAYVRLKRVAHAQRLILEGVKRTQAAQAAGFADYSTFYRACRAPRGGEPG